MKPLVSVAMTTYNGALYIEEQLYSILKQSHQDLEVVVSDDASTDDTVRIVNEFCATDRRVRLIQNEKNIGLVRNFIKAVDQCRGDMVCFSDQDDIWLPNKIEVLLDRMQASPSWNLIYSDLEVCDEGMRMTHPSYWKTSRSKPRRGMIGEKALLKNLSPGCSMMFRRNVKELFSLLHTDVHFIDMNRSGVLDEIPVMHDHLALILAAGLGEIGYAKECLVRYRQHAQNNIGAFYESRHGSGSFAKLLEARISALRVVESRLTHFDWVRMKGFLEGYRCPVRVPIPSEVGYFIWMRSGSWSGAVLGVLDCLMPSFYQSLKQSLKSREGKNNAHP